MVDQRPFLLLLSPDNLQLVTASDATDSGLTSSSLMQQTTLKPTGRTPRRHNVRPLALLHKLAHGHATPRGKGSGAGSTAGDSPTAPEAGDRDAAAGSEGLGEELEEGQLLTFSIALSQVADVECDEKRFKIVFCRQRPHKSTASNDEWKAVWKAMAFPVAFPYEGWKHRNFSVKGFMNRHYRDPFVSSVVLEADSPQEAAALHRAIEAAIGRLAHAVHWLSQDLPLDSKPVITLVTATVPDVGGGGGSCAPMQSGPRAGSEDGLGESCASPLSSPGLAAAAGVDLGNEHIICPFPRLQQPLDIPAVAPSSSGAAAELQVHVWLHSPLGPAVATISEAQLRQSAETSAPLCVTATAHSGRAQHDQQAASGAAGSANHLQVVLQFTALRCAPASRRLSTPPLLQPSGSAATSGSWTAMLAVLAVPLLAAWPQLLAGSAFPAIRVLQSVAFLVSCLAALAAIVVLQLKGRAPVPDASSQPAPVNPQAAAPAGWWRLVLLHADLVQETRQAGSAGAPPVQRVVSSSPAGLSRARSASLPLDGSALELPPAIQRLVLDSPHILTEDTAARFLLGLGHADKAYEALSKMVLWVESQGVADLVHQPQPRFEAIKKHYPQVFYSWSKVADCLLEVECTGQWRAAFDSLKALGVTDRELLRHQFFCMEYAFRVLDTRPLPQGKTVKIIDLAGLSMRDVSSAAFKWYLQVGGALLAVNYPQRLHKAFLLNAPVWSGVIWKVLAAVIPRGIRERLQLFTKKQGAEAARALLQWVPAEQLPEQYGGTSRVPLGESELELELLAYVRQLNRQQQQQQQQGLRQQQGVQPEQS